MRGENQFHAAQATAPNWQQAARDIIVDLGRISAAHRLGFLYVTDAYADDLSDIAIFLRQTTGVPHWIGTIGFGVSGGDTEYFDTPAMSVLIAPIAEDNFRIFSDRDDQAAQISRDNADWLAEVGAPLAIVHADPRNQNVVEEISALAAATNGFLVGGLTASRGRLAQLADTVEEGVISGVMLSLEKVPVQLGLTQGCAPIGPSRTITEAEENIVFTIDGRPALEILKKDIGEVLARDLSRIEGYIFAALPVAGADTADYLVRNLIGISEDEGVLAIGSTVMEGDRIMFCRRDRDSAVEDLRRMLGDLKRRAGTKAIRGGLYYSCVARGVNQFGPDSVELGIIREVLGDFPLAGFFANGEISHDRLYGHTGVLALFL
jgi:small ligand-binding sensory domain FIST